MAATPVSPVAQWLFPPCVRLLGTRLAHAVQIITFQRKRANRRVLNEDALLELLGTYAPVNVVEFNSTHSFQEQIATMSKTGVLVSVRPLYFWQFATQCAGTGCNFLQMGVVPPCDGHHWLGFVCCPADWLHRCPVYQALPPC